VFPSGAGLRGEHGDGERVRALASSQGANLHDVRSGGDFLVQRSEEESLERPLARVDRCGRSRVEGRGIVEEEFGRVLAAFELADLDRNVAVAVGVEEEEVGLARADDEFVVALLGGAGWRAVPEADGYRVAGVQQQVERVERRVVAVIVVFAGVGGGGGRIELPAAARAVASDVRRGGGAGAAIRVGGSARARARAVVTSGAERREEGEKECSGTHGGQKFWRQQQEMAPGGSSRLSPPSRSHWIGSEHDTPSPH